MTLLVLCSVSATSAFAQSCSINKPGTPCSGGSGNPINVLNGNKYQGDVDMPALPGVLGLEIVRHYNSELSKPSDANGIVGRGWRLSYETQLFSSDNYLEIREADGTMHGFSCDLLERQRCDSTDRTRGTVRRLGASGGKTRSATDAAHGSSNDYVWTWHDGRVLRFNQLGQLVQIEAPTGEFVTLQYDARGLLMLVTDPQGRQLHLHYPDRNTVRNGEGFSGVDWIDSPVGRFHFIYGSAMPKGATISKDYLIANLVRVEIPLRSAASQGSASQSILDASSTRKGIFSYDGSNNADAVATASTAAIKRSRVYHFEDALRPTYLTGISNGVIDSDGKTTEQRYSTYAYNADGKAILSTHPNDVNKVSVDYRSAGETIVTNSLGQPTVYKYAIINRQYRLLEIVGAGCHLCSAPNIRYGYDEQGRQTSVTQLTPQGQPLYTIKTELDYYGRTLKVSRIDYRDGKPQPAQLQVRYEYGPGQGPTPSAIIYPSVVPGKERVKRIKVNAAGQPLAVTESGWAPADVGASTVSTASQATAAQPTPIERTTTYRYTVINGRSLLTQIDGPLANGPSNSPADSDITAYRYDARGNFRIESISPGNHSTRTRRDATTGYSIAIDTDDGSNSAQHLTLSNNLRGQPERIVRHRTASAQHDSSNALVDRLTGWFRKDARTVTGQLITQIRYDTLGRPNRITRPDGSWLDIVTDVAGRATGARDQDGNVTSQRLDSESRLLASLRHSADASAPLDMRIAFEYDTQSRITQVTDAANAVTQYAYATAGQLTSITDAVQRRTRLDYDADGRLAALIQNADTPERAITQPGYLPGTDIVTSLTAANGAMTKNQIDDFGRSLVIDSPDSGRQVAQYDVADRLISTTDANGNRTINTWDAAGHLIARTTTGRDSSGQPAERRIQYRYQGNQLLAVVDPQQTTEWRYDANGNVADKTERLARANTDAGLGAGSGLNKNKNKNENKIKLTTLEKNDERSLVFTTRYHYDALNRLNATTLASGETVRITYGKASRLQRIELVSIDGRVTRPLATDIQLHPFTGLAGFTHGNGLITRYERNHTTGQLVALKVGTSQSTVAQALSSWMPSANAANNKSDEKVKAQSGDGTSTQPLRDLLYAQHLDYDAAGRIKAIDRTHAGQTAPANEQYGYDALDRLAKVMTPIEHAAWQYDPVGNRLSETTLRTIDQNGKQASDQSTNQTLTYQPASNRLTSLTNADKTTAYHYDPAGNPTHIGSKAYSYDVTGRLQQVSDAGKVIARYAYNAQGERISKTVFDAAGQSKTIYFLYHGNQLDAEVDASGRINAHYLYFEHTPMAKLEYGDDRVTKVTVLDTIQRWLGLHDKSRDSTLYAIHTDHLGTPQIVSDEYRRPVWQASYTAFGKASVSLEKIKLNLRFPGQYFDAETRSHYNLHRDYDPQTGRYLTSDPIGLQGGINTFAYATDNPVAFIDPFGLKVYVQSHKVVNTGGANNFGHLSILLIPDDQKNFENKPGFILGNASNGIAADKWYRVISAGPSPLFPSQISKLTGFINKSTDIPGVANSIESEVIAKLPLEYSNTCAAFAPNDTQLIKYLISLSNSYDNSLMYSYPSFLNQKLDPGKYNSNSYIKAILDFGDLSWQLTGTSGRVYPGLAEAIPYKTLKTPSYEF